MQQLFKDDCYEIRVSKNKVEIYHKMTGIRLYFAYSLPTLIEAVRELMKMRGLE